MTTRHHPHRSSIVLASTALCIALIAAACSSESGSTGGGTRGRARPPSTVGAERPVIDPGDNGHYRPLLRPSDFVDVIDNPYLPMPVGSTSTYVGRGENGAERTTVTVTDRHRTILGIAATVVHDVVRTGGQVTEDTYDWFAQDRDGNVWYLGEATRELKHGRTVTRSGSWEAGVDGAQPGVVMPAHPTVGHAYRQELRKGEAEDMAEVSRTNGRVRIGGTEHAGVVVTTEWTPLEPDVVEHKYYARGVGVVLETTVRGGHDRSQLVSRHG